MVTTTQIPVQLKQDEQNAIKTLLSQLLEKYPGEVEQVLLFGSKARGTSTADSDIDLLVLVQNETWDLREAIWTLAAHIELEYDDVIFNIQVIGIERWQKMSLERFSLCKNIEQEGNILFKR